MIRKSFAEVLIELKLLSSSDLEKYLKVSETDGITLEQYLRNNGILKDSDIARALAYQFGLEYIDVITEKMAEPSLLSKIPLKFLRENVIIPVLFQEKTTLVTSTPTNLQPIDELNLLFGGNTITALSTKQAIIDGINRYYPLEGTKQMIEELEEETIEESMDLSSIQEEDILGMASEAPIIKLVNHILYQAVKRDASDIHIEPFEKEIRVRYRIDGILYPAFMPPKRAQGALISRIKIMANLNIAEKRIPQDGRIQIKIADRAIDIRVSILPVTFGERVVMRLLDKTKTFVDLEYLDFSKRDYSIIKQVIEHPNGILLITGPTGSGKTTTLYSILSTLNKPGVNIVTVEDPVEYQLAGIGQVQVKEKIGLTFAAALRSILRQDPDIVMIGETRDHETAQIAIQSALTGHLVLSTLHTNSAAATITRLIDMGIEPFLIASTVVAIVAQRLVRKLCSNCKRAYTPNIEILSKFGLTENQAKKMVFYEPVGCEECLKTGYRGRLAIFEVMVMNQEVAQLTIAKADTNLIQKQAIKDGMSLLIEDGLKKVSQGLTTLEEVMSVATAETVIA